MRSTTLFFLLAFGIQALAGEVTTCNLGGEFNIDSITLTSGQPGSIEIQFADEGSETLSPIAKTGGLFGDIRFLSRVPSGSSPDTWNYLAITSDFLGEVYFQYTCSNPHSDVFCISRGGSASKAVMRIAIENQAPIRMLCDWNPN